MIGIKVETNNEFKEIMNDFTNPLEVIREAIQNSIDASANNITIIAEKEDTSGGELLNVIIDDDGDGLKPENFKNFFNLGDSTKSNDKNTVGEKGHGTKIFYNSKKVILESWVENKKYVTEFDEPRLNIMDDKKMEYKNPEEVHNNENKTNGVRITIKGYLFTSNNPFDKFSHPSIKDYIQWFTLFGSVEQQFRRNGHDNKKIYLKSFDSIWDTSRDFKIELNSDGFEELSYGHYFPNEEITKQNALKKKAEEFGERKWEDMFCKQLYCEELAIDGLTTPVQVVIWVEGDKYKRTYNPLLRERSSNSSRNFQYKVSDRYGFWACKDYIPIERVDDWIPGKGTYTKFHAFINYNGFSLTANRSSINNTDPDIISKIKEKLEKVFENKVSKNRSYINWLELQTAASQQRSADEEDKEYDFRIKNCSKRKKVKIGSVTYYEPFYEGEVALLFDGILQVFPDIWAIEILDYNTHKGIDFLIRENLNVEIEQDNTIGYVELKNNFEKGRFNHSFKNLRKIVCYDTKGLKISEKVKDLRDIELIVKKDDNENWFLLDENNFIGHNISIIILKDFLKSKDLEFK